VIHLQNNHVVKRISKKKSNISLQSMLLYVNKLFFCSKKWYRVNFYLLILSSILAYRWLEICFTNKETINLEILYTSALFTLSVCWSKLWDIVCWAGLRNHFFWLILLSAFVCILSPISNLPISSYKTYFIWDFLIFIKVIKTLLILSLMLVNKKSNSSLRLKSTALSSCILLNSLFIS